MDLTPKWEPVMEEYISVLASPVSSARAKRAIADDLRRVARRLDEMNLRDQLSETVAQATEH